MKLRSFIFAVVAVSLFSCASKEDKDVIDESLLPPAGAKAAQPVTQQDTALNAATGAQQSKMIVPPGTNPEASRANLTPSTAAAAQTVPAAVPSDGKLNPPHGQPGHRCDINVGAPLNSKPAQQPAVTQATVSNPPAIISSPAAQQQTLPGMNPPHGQPGHRCDIAVGAPLNSKPAPVAAPVTVAPPQKDSAKNK